MKIFKHKKVKIKNGKSSNVIPSIIFQLFSLIKTSATIIKYCNYIIFITKR